MMREPPHVLASVGRALKNLLTERAQRRCPVGVVAYDAPRFVIGEHREMIRLRPIASEGNHGLELMRSRIVSDGVLISPVVVADHDLPAIVAVTRREVRCGVGQSLNAAGLQVDSLEINSSAELGLDGEITSGLVEFYLIEIREAHIAN